MKNTREENHNWKFETIFKWINTIYGFNWTDKRQRIKRKNYSTNVKMWYGINQICRRKNIKIEYYSFHLEK